MLVIGPTAEIFKYHADIQTQTAQQKYSLPPQHECYSRRSQSASLQTVRGVSGVL